MNKEKLESISQTLKSNTRDRGPRLYHPGVTNIVGGSTNKISDFAIKTITIFYNLTPPEYYEETLKERNTCISSSGALVAYSGIKTGRSPYDKRIVKCDDVWYGENSPNVAMDNTVFNINRETAICYLNQQDKLYVFDGFACWHPTHKLKVRVVSSRAYHCFFMHNMLIRPTSEELKYFGEPEVTLYNAGCFPANRYNDTMTSSTSVNLNLKTKEIVILGTQYAGEMKKAIFSYLHYTMPKMGILSLHSSCNISYDKKNICMFFGLSGTGKTTLSADSSRKLIGDDEHCWDDNGVFNIEGGCYAKIIDLDPKKEQDIYKCIRFGSLLENTMLNNKRDVDFKNDIITRNTRLAYPVHYMNNAQIPCICSHPNNIILLTCDAFGVLPLVSHLTTDQTIYHFINGYTSKIAGTEDGIVEPQATFSSCYGEAFLTLHPTTYANMLRKKIIKHNVNCWLVNTGWVGGPYDLGKRCDLKITREIVNAIHDGSLLKEKYFNYPIFDLKVPIKYDINHWDDKSSFMTSLKQLYSKFEYNYSKFVV